MSSKSSFLYSSNAWPRLALCSSAVISSPFRASSTTFFFFDCFFSRCFCRFDVLLRAGSSGS